MKFIALTYNYDLTKLSDIGRKWSYDVYKNKEFIFDYSAASYASFIDKNPTAILHIYTDDVQLISQKMNEYSIDQNRVKYINFIDNINKFNGNLKYSFEILNELINVGKSETEYTIKIDNDLIFNDKLIINDTNSILVWKYERIVKNGDPRWGEIKICQEILNNIDFKIYNMGIFGYPTTYQNQEAKELMHQMMNIDISNVTDVGANIYHCTEQTANNWIFNKYNYNMIETFDVVDHLFDNKGECINRMKYLKK